MDLDVFTDDPVDLTEQRLKEAPGQEDHTIKEAGHNETWRSFLDRMFKEGWDDAVRGAHALDKEASDDPYQEGRRQALEKISHLHQSPYARGYYRFLKHAHDERDMGEDVTEIAKEALDQDPQSDVEAGFLGAAEAVLNSNLEKAAWEGPESYSTDDGDTQMSNQNPFEMGKQASFQEVVEGAYQGAGFTDILKWASQTANRDLEKNASEEAVDFRLGAEAVCYGLHKQAAALEGNFPIEDKDAALEVSLEKMAAGEPVPEDPDNEAYRIGKEAAFKDLAERFEDGQKIGDVLGDVRDTITRNVKEASQEEKVAQRGIDNVCFSFLEKAAALYGNFRTESEEDERRIFKAALDEVAAEDELALKEARAPQEQKQEDEQGMSTGQKAGLGAAGLLGGAALADTAQGALKSDKSGLDAVRKHLAHRKAQTKGIGRDLLQRLKGEKATMSDAVNEDGSLGTMGDIDPSVGPGGDLPKAGSLAKEAGLIGETENEQTSTDKVEYAIKTLEKEGAFEDGSLEELEAAGLLDD